MVSGRRTVRRLVPLVAVAVTLAAAPAYAALTSSAVTGATFTAATLAAPTGVTVSWTCNAGTLEATVGWSTVVHADRYELWWTMDPTAGWTLVSDSVTGNSLTHPTTATPNSTVHHRVVARTAVDWTSPNADVQTNSGACGGGGGGGGGPGGPGGGGPKK